MKLAIIKCFVIAVVAAVYSINIAAQSPPSMPVKDKESLEYQKPRDLFRELGLTKEQIDQIRALRSASRDEVSAAQKKLRETGKALDAAIYADLLDEQIIELRITERDQAQAEVSRLKTMNELELRKILTPEQLLKFRNIREMYTKRQEEIKQRRGARKKDISQSPRDTRPRP